MRWVIWIDKRRGRDCVVIVFIVIFFWLSSSIDMDSISRVLTTTWDVVTSQNAKNKMSIDILKYTLFFLLPESIDPCTVFDSVCFAIISHIAVLSHSLIVTHTLFSVDNSILLSKCRPKLASSCIESLLLKDSGKWGVTNLSSAMTQSSQDGNLNIFTILYCLNKSQPTDTKILAILCSGNNKLKLVTFFAKSLYWISSCNLTVRRVDGSQIYQ